MKFTKCFFVTAFAAFAITIFSAQITQAESKANPQEWQKHMRELSNSLIDVFPFLYSHSEFRDPANKKTLTRVLNKLSTTAHSLPDEGGKAFIGAEPLIKDARVSLNADFKKARELFEKNSFDEAQTTAQYAVQKCFACHTAHQVGPQFSNTNREVMNIATPFATGKIIVFGALRQFGGALEYIEKQKPTVELAKLHLVISARSIQDFKRAESYIKKFQRAEKDQEVLKMLSQWQVDLKNWKQNSAAKSTGFVGMLRESLLLHNKISADKNSVERKETFKKLGEIYSNLGVAELKPLAEIYMKAE
jgi:hypothetical protein